MFLANRKQLWIINIVYPRQLLTQVLTQAQSELSTGFADVINGSVVFEFGSKNLWIDRVPA
jgi:hypothetical protein